MVSRTRKIDSSRLLLLKTQFPANVSEVINFVLYASILPRKSIFATFSPLHLRPWIFFRITTSDILAPLLSRNYGRSLNGGRRSSRLILNDRTSSHYHHPRYRLLHSSILFSRHSWLEPLQLQVPSLARVNGTWGIYATARNPFSLLRTLSNQVCRPAERGQGEGGAVLNHESWLDTSFSHLLAEQREPGRANVPPGGWPVDCSPSSENSRLKQPPWVCTGGIIGARALGGA